MHSRSSPQLEPLLGRRILWALRSIARREHRLDADAKRLTEPGLRTWHGFAGRLHLGDFVSLLIENDARSQPLALQPPAGDLDAETGSALVDEALRGDPGLLGASRSNFLEAAATAFGRPPLDPARRARFGDIRMGEHQILELPSTAARVAAAVADRDAPLDTYVSYVVATPDDEFLVGLAMLEFNRPFEPRLLRVTDLRAGKVPTVGFSRTATLGGEDDLLMLLPRERLGSVIVL